MLAATRCAVTVGPADVEVACGAVAVDAAITGCTGAKDVAVAVKIAVAHCAELAVVAVARCAGVAGGTTVAL